VIEFSGIGTNVTTRRLGEPSRMREWSYEGALAAAAINWLENIATNRRSHNFAVLSNKGLRPGPSFRSICSVRRLTVAPQ
jgi:hypothetical protein